ncbi:hypothetical protein NV379_17435 [Paenibacillus sp. N1-5-1-14]|uniref:hypothetical protein n=1 Tax=Paenibacillus radicibacter TaxID=2972488 RepID=UPI002159A83D|nr:hypothetical protein [Paenibacillus radicibacter]MCR8644440.1 hypothetical protein [Paenibacillus radicibacter]
MQPTEIIEIMIFVIVIVINVIILIFLKGNWRKIGLILALTTFVVYCIFLVARPFWIDAQIDKKVELLESYLEEHYPKEEWTISTVPHRKEGFKNVNQYYIGVVFENEPEVTYDYWVESKNNIYQISYSTKNGLKELKHMEKLNE